MPVLVFYNKPACSETTFKLCEDIKPKGDNFLKKPEIKKNSWKQNSFKAAIATAFEVTCADRLEDRKEYKVEREPIIHCWPSKAHMTILQP